MPACWHFVTQPTYTWWSVNQFTEWGVILGESRLLALSPSPRHPGEGCKSCCPLVMTEHEEEPRERRKRKSSWIRVLLSPLSVWVRLCSSACLFHSLSACALLLCHPQGCVWRRPSVDPFVSCFASCAAASLLSMIRPGLSPAHPLCCCQQALRERRVCCWGWGMRLCPPVSDSHKERMGIGRHVSFLYAHTING